MRKGDWQGFKIFLEGKAPVAEVRGKKEKGHAGGVAKPPINSFGPGEGGGDEGGTRDGEGGSKSYRA